MYAEDLPESYTLYQDEKISKIWRFSQGKISLA